MSARTFECPQCGADVPHGRRACPECGSDDATGWGSSEEIDYQSIELPDAEETAAPRPGRAGWLRLVVVLAAAALLWWLVARR